MVSDYILEFLHRHEGLQVWFQVAKHFDNSILIGFSDPWNGESFDYAMSEIEMRNNVFVKCIVDKAEKEMHGDKEDKSD